MTARFNSFSKAVRYALENTDIGTKSSLKTLAKRSSKFYSGEFDAIPIVGGSYMPGYAITLNAACSTACNVRSKFRQERGLDEDARTYETQCRRDMRSDVKMPRDRWNKVQNLLEKVEIDTIKELLQQFHSIDQFNLAVSTYVQTAEFVCLDG